MHPVDDDPTDVDPGLQPHRTALAWHRTAVAVAAVAVLVGLVAYRHSESVALAFTPIAVPLLLSAVMLGRERQLRAAEPHPMGTGAAVVVVGAPIALGLLGLWVVSGL